MLSAVGTALWNPYVLVAGAAINRQTGNTQIQGIYNAEKVNAKAAFDAGKLPDGRAQIQSIAGVQGSLQTTLGQIYGNQTTNVLIANANRTMQIQQMSSMTYSAKFKTKDWFTDRTKSFGDLTSKRKVIVGRKIKQINGQHSQ